MFLNLVIFTTESTASCKSIKGFFCKPLPYINTDFSFEAFNRNLLARINRELEGDFEVDQYDFQVKWNSTNSRIESYLVSRRDQTVCISAVNCCVRFVKGEAIWTESSHKYESAEVAEMGRVAGFECQEQWVEPTSEFMITCFGVR